MVQVAKISRMMIVRILIATTKEKNKTMTTQPRQLLYSVSISGRVILDLHSLNNEGSEGNQLNARQVYIVTGDGRNPTPANVNAISGDMLKHIQTEHFR